MLNVLLNYNWWSDSGQF